jgi:hypothetical protein
MSIDLTFPTSQRASRTWSKEPSLPSRFNTAQTKRVGFAPDWAAMVEDAW